MKRIEKIFLAVGLVIIFLISGGIYLNNKIDSLLNNVGVAGVILSQEITEGGKVGQAPRTDSSPDDKDNSGKKGFAVNKGTSASAEDLVFDEGIEAIIQTKLNKPIERKDKIKVALILLKNLSIEDITYFYDLVTLDYSREDIFKARAILSANLNKEDMETLRSMAVKYGFNP